MDKPAARRYALSYLMDCTANDLAPSQAMALKVIYHHQAPLSVKAREQAQILEALRIEAERLGVDVIPLPPRDSDAKAGKDGGQGDAAGQRRRAGGKRESAGSGQPDLYAG